MIVNYKLLLLTMLKLFLVMYRHKSTQQYMFGKYSFQYIKATPNSIDYVFHRLCSIITMQLLLKMALQRNVRKRSNEQPDQNFLRFNWSSENSGKTLIIADVKCYTILLKSAIIFINYNHDYKLLHYVYLHHCSNSCKKFWSNSFLSSYEIPYFNFHWLNWISCKLWGLVLAQLQVV